MVAIRLGRPVKWIETRSENAQATHHGRDQIQEVELAANNDGKILGMRVDLLANMGAYMMIISPGIPILGEWMYNSIYKMEAYDFTCTGVFTTTTPTDAYRGAGRPEATFAIERMMDDLAAELGMDPMELRKQELDQAPRVPVQHDLRDDLRQRQLRGRDRQGRWRCSTTTGCAPSRQKRRADQGPGPAGHRHLDLHRDVRPGTVADAVGAEVRRRRLGALHRSGSCPPARSSWSPARRRTARATSPPGARSPRTRWASIPTTSRSSTATPASAPYGMDTYGSRSLVVGGMAVAAGRRARVEKAKVVAAHMLEATRTTWSSWTVSFTVKGTPGSSQDDPGGRLRGLHLARPARRHRADPVRPARRSTRTTSPSRTARTCARSRSTPRPG